MSYAAVYRMLAADGRLLYVGCSTKLPARMNQHAATKDWWSRVATVTVEHFDGLKAATAAEMKAIAEESPEFNRSPGFVARHDTLEDRRQARIARRKANWFDPQGTIVCQNCGRTPDRFPRKPVEDVSCADCGQDAYTRIGTRAA